MFLLTLVWAALLVLLGLLPGWAPGFILGVPVVMLFYAWLGIGAALAIVTALLLKEKKHLSAGTLLRNPGILFIVLAISLGLWFEPALGRQGERLHYNSHRAKYQAVVDSISASTPHRPAWAGASVGSFVVDTGPPLRVAFIRSSWLSDWEGIIFDPDDSLQAWQEHAPRRSVRLFGRAVIGCNRREPKWFECGTLPDERR